MQGCQYHAAAPQHLVLPAAWPGAVRQQWLRAAAPQSQEAVNAQRSDLAVLLGTRWVCPRLVAPLQEDINRHHLQETEMMAMAMVPTHL